MKTSTRILLTLSLIIASASSVSAQLYTGLTGLIHTPSAEMMDEGDIMVGGYYMNKHFTPDAGFSYNGRKFGTYDFYLSIAPFSWVEVSYTFTLQKTPDHNNPDRLKFNHKDRYFSIKFNPLREGKYWPAIAIGSNDFIGSPTKNHANEDLGEGYFNNYFIAATKHFNPYGQEIGVNLAYRYSPKDFNRKWNGVVGGLTWRPRWVPQLRVMVEYTGDGINFGADCLLWRHLFIQAAVLDGRYFTGGMCFRANLF